MSALATQTAAASGTRVEVGYLEHDRPSVGELLTTPSSDTAAQAPRRTLGLLLSDGYHAGVDVPAALAAAAVPVVDCGTLGLGEWTIEALDDALQPHTGRSVSPIGVALVAAGSSRPEARDQVIALAAAWQRVRGAPVRAAFASGSGPSIDEALSMLTDTGCAQRVIALLMLAPGVLADRVAEAAAAHDVPVTEPLLVAAHGKPLTAVISRILTLTAESPRR